MGHLEAMAAEHRLPDGRTLFSDVSFRVGRRPGASRTAAGSG
ncbi:hypothetical protein [Pseudonocardia adelaidensis]